MCPLSPRLLSLALEVLARAARQEKEVKDIRIGKEDEKFSLFADYAILYIEIAKNFTQKLSELIKKFSN